MSYRIVLNERAEDQLESAYLWWFKHRSVEQATNWYNGFVDALQGLSENPHRFGLAREDQRFPYEVRELLYGLGSRPTHRALFTIRNDIVYVFSIRHAAQRDVTACRTAGRRPRRIVADSQNAWIGFRGAGQPPAAVIRRPGQASGGQAYRHFDQQWGLAHTQHCRLCSDQATLLPTYPSLTLRVTRNCSDSDISEAVGQPPSYSYSYSYSAQRYSCS